MIVRLYFRQFCKIIPFRALNFSRSLSVSRISKKLSKCYLFAGSFGAPFTIINIGQDEDDRHNDVIEKPSTHSKSPIRESCFNSINLIDEFLMVFAEAVTASGNEYKGNLNKLIKLLEEKKIVNGNSELRSVYEDAIIAMKADITDSKKQFLELITIVETVEKMARAASELSFLISEENKAFSISKTIDLVKEIINSELNEVKNFEAKVLKIEKDLIQER